MKVGVMSLQNRMAAVVRRASVLNSGDDAANQRWARRKPATTPAKILFDGITTPYDCMVRDISSTGVQLELSKTKFNPEGSTESIPHHFTLIITLDKTAVECHSMWRRGSKLGARFTGMVRTIAQPKFAARPAKPIKKG
jgi:hypothetical protein